MRKVLIVRLGLVLLLVAPVHADLTGPITNFADVEKQLEALTRKGDILEQKVQTLSDRVTTLEQHAQAATGVYERVRPAVVSLQAEGEDNLGLP